MKTSSNLFNSRPYYLASLIRLTCSAHDADSFADAAVGNIKMGTSFEGCFPAVANDVVVREG